MRAREFLDKLWQVAWAPIEEEATKQIDFRGRTEKQKQLYLFVPSHAKLKKQLGELVGGTDSFFRYAEGAYIGDLIDEVRITVKKRDEHGGKVSFTQLSEGELQMLTVLGLMRITREDHCLSPPSSMSRSPPEPDLEATLLRRYRRRVGTSVG